MLKCPACGETLQTGYRAPCFRCSTYIGKENVAKSPTFSENMGVGIIPDVSSGTKIDLGYYILTREGELIVTFPEPKRHPVYGIYFSSIWKVNKTGELFKIFDPNGVINSYPAIGSDGTIYLGTYTHKLYALSAEGEKYWHVDIGHEVYAHISVDRKGIVYVAGFDKDGLYAVSPEGKIEWAFRVKGEIYSEPRFGRDRSIYFSDHERIYALDENGELKWSYNLPLVLDPPVIDDANEQIYFHSSEGEGKIVAFDFGGNLLWEITTMPESSDADHFLKGIMKSRKCFYNKGNPIETTKSGLLVYMESNRSVGNELMVLDLEGKEIGSLTLPPDSIYTVWGDTIFIGLKYGEVLAYSIDDITSSAEPLWEKSDPNPSIGLVVRGDKLINVGLIGMSAYNLSGELLWFFADPYLSLPKKEKVTKRITSLPIITDNGLLYSTEECDSSNEFYRLHLVRNESFIYNRIWL
ncbi:MAG: PQQ-binding-like beta-propeller repeat protein [Archaeoglobus sp.]|nr:PQQ-binding-like beta-propeller repeat protein [Archaeoglobus sp.]